jgi:D-tyrosyl-tRNA(Tyr) deacylase
VVVEGKTFSEIGAGLLVFLGVARTDTDTHAAYLAEKAVNLRIFDDHEGKLNCSLLDVGGEMLVVSQFTLYGDCRKGRRPSYSQAAPPDMADRLYSRFVERVQEKGVRVNTGKFRAHMRVELTNDGPVTLIIDSI